MRPSWAARPVSTRSSSASKPGNPTLSTTAIHPYDLFGDTTGATRIDSAAGYPAGRDGGAPSAEREARTALPDASTVPKKAASTGIGGTVPRVPSPLEVKNAS